MKRLLAALALAAFLAPAARALMPSRSAKADAKRFGLDRFEPVVRKLPSAATRRAVSNFHGGTGRWKVRYSPRTGLPNSFVGGRDDARPGKPDAVARQFLSAHMDMFGVDPTGLTLEKQTSGNAHNHLLYRQSYRGLPVEFSAVKVHIRKDGSVVGVHSTYEPGISLPTTPRVSPSAAVAAAVADAGGNSAVRAAPALVVVPLDGDGLDHLAWKMRVDGPGGGWRYYVDALTGQVLFRYGIESYSGCFSSGVVSGMVYDIDPSSTPGPGGLGFPRAFNNQYVYVANPPVQVLTGVDPTFGGGYFCGPPGQVSMSLQGPYVSVGQFRGASAHYDDGGGQWVQIATPVSSPHPYSANSVSVATINLTGAVPTNAVSFLPVFQDFHVGGFDGGSSEGTGAISQDDQLFMYDGNDNPVSLYIGDIPGFNAAEIHGLVGHLAIRALSGGTNTGYDIAVSSVLVLSSPNADNAPLSSHTWTAADTSQNLNSEISLFYNLNKMHDYFLGDVDKSSAASIVKPVVAMADVGPNLLNAFYDPDYDALYFGDGGNAAFPNDWFADDATVPHHEYVHYVVEKIWHIQNYGQAGALSEANADYFSASSLDDSAIGNYVNQSLGNAGALRELDCTKPNITCEILGNSNTGWTGEIHSDSPFLSQALWEIRVAAIASLGHALGRSCADGLEFQSLLGFPESFGELYDDMIENDHAGAVAACGGANAMQANINAAFGHHGIIPVVGDAYDPNGGFETAVDISTLGAISATIYPAAESDFFSFGAGPGLVAITMNLPFFGPGLYKDYQLKLYNASRQLVAGAAPPSNGFGTLDGYCDVGDCETTAKDVALNYDNPTGGLMYVQVIGGDSLFGSNSGVNSTTPYRLSVSFPHPGALSGAVVGAKFDNDAIGFTVNTSTFGELQDWNFASAQLRDQSQNVIANTLTHVPAALGDWLTFVSSTSAGGVMSGRVQLVPGFGARFPAAGTVELEVFAYDVHGSTSSMGLSNPFNLSANQTSLTAYNNLLNPAKGQKATVQYEVSGSGQLTVKLYTVTGRLVSTLFDGQVTAGKGSVDWSGTNAAGSIVASGIYVVRAVGPGLNTTQKIAVVK